MPLYHYWAALANTVSQCCRGVLLVVLHHCDPAKGFKPKTSSIHHICQPTFVHNSAMLATASPSFHIPFPYIRVVICIPWHLSNRIVSGNVSVPHGTSHTFVLGLYLVKQAVIESPLTQSTIFGIMVYSISFYAQGKAGDLAIIVLSCIV